MIISVKIQNQVQSYAVFSEVAIPKFYQTPLCG